MKDEASYICESCGEEIVVPIDLSQLEESARRNIAAEVAQLGTV